MVAMKLAIGFCAFLSGYVAAQGLGLPANPGPYAVGQTRVEIVDPKRNDPWSPKVEPRRIVLTITYPIATNSSTKKAKYLPSKAAKYVEENLKIPKGTTAVLNTRIFVGGKPITPLLTKDNKLPITVFSPGAGVASAEYATFINPFASYGYYVIGMDHLYDSSPVETMSGEVIAGNLGDRNHTLNSIVTGTRRDDAMYLASQLTIEQLKKWLPAFDAEAVTPKGVKLGIYGQSLGGSTASLALESDKSPYVAGISFDGPFYNTIATKGMHGPFLYLIAENSETHETLDKEWPLIRGWKRAIMIRNTTHYDYSDLNVLVPLAKGTLLAESYGPKMGKIGDKRRLAITNAYLKAFWDFSLLGQPAASFFTKPGSAWPEIDVQKM